ncbi:MAG TPA: hypothetical protein DDX39_12570 [Bacteroidales bacterium]|nr:MAG: hypothetical protein A2W98_05425 [Bacteroidetes bacterium GWF2_33_38]OFY92021.1 MAG: hypothetical protein A2236_10185 [Bacteroidetes bacterium RIFOXYA2_FULL_33_7]HBF89466.1 hypothetical protein [Bacteroidales bacterium]
MNFPLYIAKRYLFSKKSTNVINLISIISVIGVTVGTTALIVILSVFNGFDSLITSLFNSFNPDLQITVKEGKTFVPDEAIFNQIKTHKAVHFYSETIEDNALLKHKDKQYIATIKGVSDNYVNMSGIDSMIVDGEFLLRDQNRDYALIGQGVAYYLSIGLNYVFPTISIYVPKRKGSVSLSPENAFNRNSIMPSGIFSIQQDFDSKYVIVPLDFARKLYDYTNEVSAIELKINDYKNVSKVQKEISQILGDKYKVKNRYEQNELLFKIMESEKWAIFLILSFILIIASFNVIGSLTMLIIDKKNDIFILRSLGADYQLIRRIFLFEGWMISFLGAVVGLLLGLFICFLQEKVGLIKLQGSGSFVIENYPVEVHYLDLFYVFATVMLIGFLASWYPVRYITKKFVALS